MDRRLFLRALAAAGCSAAAHPWLTTVTLAEGAPGWGENRLVVVILRGAMDGLDLVQPRGEAAFARLRPTLAAGPAADLTGVFALHPGVPGLLPLWAAGELAFAHAVSTPYRDARSHFDGQDLLEAGTGLDVAPGAVRDGWLNRLVGAVPGSGSETAYAVGREALPLLAGPAPARDWAPDQRLLLSAQARLLLDHVYHDDPLFRETAAEAFALAEAGEGGAGEGGPMADVDALVDFAAGRLRGSTRIAAFSQTGWDTHRGQARAMARPLARLERTILRLREQLGPAVWGRTLFLAMTEFGRTAAENGTGGTDHGTAGAMVLAGGALRGGRVLGDWPGLEEAALYARRDLMPTRDVRAFAAHGLRGMFGLDRAVLERTVFPGLEMGADPGLLR
jgi:uncharacterized protein (DUF1501 family)